MMQPEHAALSEEQKETKAAEIAKEKFAREIASKEGSETLAYHVISHLEDLLEQKDVTLAASELLRQSTVLVWGTLEALANDLFISLLNENADLSTALLKDERTRKRFQLRDPMLALLSYNYNLADHMGDALNDSQKLDDVESIRATFDVLFPGNDKLRELLLAPSLWRLYQRRNLILHRRGVVDRAYLKNTGENLEVGSELIVTAGDLDKDLALIFKIGFEALKAVAETARICSA